MDFVHTADLVVSVAPVPAVASPVAAACPLPVPSAPAPVASEVLLYYRPALPVPAAAAPIGSASAEIVARNSVLRSRADREVKTPALACKD